jgi:tetratricopeptide (TPR) repeat protein
VNTAQATGYLALAHLEGGDASRAVALLEQAVSALRGFHPGFRQTLARFLAALSEARLAAGQPEAAEPPALEALRLAQEVTFGYGLGLAQRALGQIAAARGDAARARVWLDEAVQTFDAMMARVEVARARLALAEVAHLDGDAAEADRLLRAARADFAAVGAPRWEARVRQRAAAWGGRSP